MKSKITHQQNQNNYCIYCSGPLFCPGELGEMLTLAQLLENKGFTTFLPQRDGIESLVMSMVNSPFNVNMFNIRKALDRAIFSLDIYQIIERCDALVFNMNGRVPDEGGVAETAIAWAFGKPIVIYKNDARTAFKGMDNSMITGLVRGKIVRSLNKIPDTLEKILHSKSVGNKTMDINNLPPEMARAITIGRRIWAILERRKTSRKKTQKLILKIADLIAKG